MLTNTLRYQLPKKAIKSNCPHCGPRHRKTLSRYFDTKTGEPLPDEYGRCDRENNCTYHFSPYDKGPSGLSYAEEQFERWKHDNPLSDRREVSPSSRRATRQPPKPVHDRPPTIVEIPDDLFRQSLGHYHHNQLALLLQDHFGEAVAANLLQRFQIGTSSHWPGACIFWYIDEQQRVRGGQIKLLGADWHTVKYVDRENKTRSKTQWVNTVLKRRLETAQEPLPNWLDDYDKFGDRSPCLFGLPQLKTVPADQPFAIVEAPKTAIVATAYLPQFVWLAVGAKSYLNAERLEPLRGRRVTLFPDLAACYDSTNPIGRKVKGWKTIADELNQQGFHIDVSEYLEQHATDEQKGQGLDIADFLLAKTIPSVVHTLTDWVSSSGSILRPDVSQLHYL